MFDFQMLQYIVYDLTNFGYVIIGAMKQMLSFNFNF